MLPPLWSLLDCYQLLLLYNNFICNSSLIISRRFLLSYPINQEPSLVSFEDYDLLLRLSYNKFVFSYLPFNLTAYFINPNSIQNPSRTINAASHFLKDTPSIAFYPLLYYIILSSKYTQILSSISQPLFKHLFTPLKLLLVFIYVTNLLFIILPSFLISNFFSTNRSSIRVLN